MAKIQVWANVMFLYNNHYCVSRLRHPETPSAGDSEYNKLDLRLVLIIGNFYEGIIDYERKNLTSSPFSRINHIAFRYICICSDDAVPIYSSSFLLSFVFMRFLLSTVSITLYRSEFGIKFKHSINSQRREYKSDRVQSNLVIYK